MRWQRCSRSGYWMVVGSLLALPVVVIGGFFAALGNGFCGDRTGDDAISSCRSGARGAAGFVGVMGLTVLIVGLIGVFKMASPRPVPRLPSARLAWVGVGLAVLAVVALLMAAVTTSSAAALWFSLGLGLMVHATVTCLQGRREAHEASVSNADAATMTALAGMPIALIVAIAFL